MSGVYLIGLLVLVFATGYRVSIEDQQKYSEVMSELSPDNPLMKKLKLETKLYWKFDEEYHNTKGWFTCNWSCNHALSKRKHAEREINMVKYEIAQVEARAKSHLGVWSEQSVEEARNLFWQSFAGGKEFSQTSSWFDLFFMGIDSIGRDEHLAAFVIRFIFQLVMNFTIGMIGAFISFWWNIGAVVSSYSPSYFAGWFFYLLALAGAFSAITSFLLLLYFSAAGTVFVAVNVAGPQILLQAGQPRRSVTYRRF